jgi:hypothetical protein
MRTRLLAGIVLMCAAAVLGAQAGSTEPSPSQAAPTKKAAKTITLSGCLRGGDVGTDLFTVVDAKGATTYRLSGADVRPHVGRRVQIVGGLLPSPNVAAQASAIDPAQAAIATATTGSYHPELRVTRVRPLAGTCVQPGQK